MISKVIKGATHRLAKPENWNDKNGTCGHLHVRAVPHGALVRYESAWEPTPEELAILQAGGSIVVSVIGGQPPIAVYAEE